jgi:gamma-glutamyltranspeptidase/glutathione hydrolase
MHRRSFLQMAAGASAGAYFGQPARAGAAASNRGETTAMRVHSDLLADRNQNRSTVVCQNGIVCASQPLATMAGIDILKAGGNAVDAAIAANAMLGLVEPMSCGIGGDLFAILWVEGDRKLYGLNASGRAPYGWNLNEAKKLKLDQIPVYSPLAWNVPGCVGGWAELLKRFGRTPLAKILEPAIRYGREGFPVSPIIAGGWAVNAKQYPTLAATYAPEGRAPRFGEMFKNPELAASLELIARDGADAFYKGEIADRIVNFSQAVGGRFSKRDFTDHTATWVQPVSANYRGYDVWEIPPNGQGIAALQMLNMLERFDIAALRPNSPEHLHLFIEAKKLAFEDRAVYYADPEFADVPVKRLISKDYGVERAKLIDPKRAAQKVAPGRLAGGAETIYLTAADRDGNMVSLIQSNYHGWGSHYVPDHLGFCLQNRGSGFSLRPADRNRLEPHKRPFHTIIPVFVTREGRPVLSFGVMGGDFQPQGHVQVLLNLLDFGFSPQQAGEQPRVEHIESSTFTGIRATGPGAVNLERGIPDEVRQALADMGHTVRKGVGAFGGYQGIWREENPRRYFGGSDPRKDGCAIGY